MKSLASPVTQRTGTPVSGRSGRGTHKTRLIPSLTGLLPALAAAFIALVLLGPLIAPKPPTQSTSSVLASPSGSAPLGTDELGRDVLSRVISGGQYLTLSAIMAGVLCIVVGGVIGLVSAYRGGWIDNLLMRLVDVALAMPAVLIILILSASLHMGYALLTLLTGLLQAPAVGRVIRGAAQSVLTRDYVASAEAAGESSVGILGFEVLPNIRRRVAAEFGVRTAFAILIISSLNFLGVGASPPKPNWGLDMLASKETLSMAPWATLGPAIAIFLLVNAVMTLASHWGSHE